MYVIQDLIVDNYIFHHILNSVWRTSVDLYIYERHEYCKIT